MSVRPAWLVEAERALDARDPTQARITLGLQIAEVLPSAHRAALLIAQAIEQPPPEHLNPAVRASYHRDNIVSVIEEELSRVSAARTVLVYAGQVFAVLRKLEAPRISFPEPEAIESLIGSEVSVRGHGGAAVHYFGLCAIQTRELAGVFGGVLRALDAALSGSGTAQFEEAVVFASGEIDSRLITLVMTARLTRGY